MIAIFVKDASNFSASSRLGQGAFLHQGHDSVIIHLISILLSPGFFQALGIFLNSSVHSSSECIMIYPFDRFINQTSSPSFISFPCLLLDEAAGELSKSNQTNIYFSIFKTESISSLRAHLVVLDNLEEEAKMNHFCVFFSPLPLANQ